MLSLLKKASEAEVVAFDLSLTEVKALAAAYGDSDNADQFDHNCKIAIDRSGVYRSGLRGGMCVT